MSRLRTVIVALCIIPSAALALEAPTTPTAPHTTSQATQDPPVGFPYNTGDSTQSQTNFAQVPLRDFLSSRQDQQRAELIERIHVLERQFNQIIDERDRQYAQRFEAQQEALQAALSAAKEAVANALTAADRAVAKAEGAAEKRFESVNEFRQTLTDQAATFISKDTAEARFAGLEKAVGDIERGLNSIRDAGEGKSDLVGWLVGVAGVLLAFGALLFNMNKSRQREHEARP